MTLAATKIIKFDNLLSKYFQATILKNLNQLLLRQDFFHLLDRQLRNTCN